MERVAEVRGSRLQRKEEREMRLENLARFWLSRVEVSPTALFLLLASFALPPSLTELLGCDLARRTLKYVGRNRTIITGIG